MKDSRIGAFGTLTLIVTILARASLLMALLVLNPFDIIVLSGSVPQVPRPLLEQLREGGRLVAIVGEEPVMRATLYTRSGPQAFAQTELFDTVAPRLLGFPEPSQFRF
jgi:protein-L-isoaspartate(D-aspartate) O-methyltransferase